MMGYHYKGPQLLDWNQGQDSAMDGANAAMARAVLVYRDSVLHGATHADALDAAVQWLAETLGEIDRAASRATITGLIRESRQQLGGWFWRLTRL